MGRAIGSSRFVIITTLMTDDERKLERVIRKIWTRKRHNKDAQELHAVHSSDPVRHKVLGELSKLNVEVTFRVIDKVSVASDLQHVSYMTLADIVYSYEHGTNIVVDKKDTVLKRSGLLKQLTLEQTFHAVRFCDSRKVKQLQAVDFVSWAYYQYIEYGNDEYMFEINKLMGISGAKQ